MLNLNDYTFKNKVHSNALGYYIWLFGFSLRINFKWDWILKLTDFYRFCSHDYYPFDARDVKKYVVGDDYTPVWEVHIERVV